MRRPLRERLLRRRRVLQHAPATRVQDLRGRGTPSAPASPSAGAKPRDASRARRRPWRPAGSTAHATARAPAASTSRNTMCKPGMCDGDAVVGAFACDGVGAASRARRVSARPSGATPPRARATTTCTQQPVRQRPAVRRGQLRQAHEGRAPASERRLRLGLLRRRRLLQRRLPGRLRLLHLLGPRGDLLADRRGPARPARRLPRRGGGELRDRPGLCDGFGGCAKYARDTVCIAADLHGQPPQHAGHLRRPRHLPAPRAFRTATRSPARTARARRLATPTPTATTGIACVNGTCGPKQDGQSCRRRASASHNHCVDGVCCDQRVRGRLPSCALSSSLGRCTPIAAGHRRSARRVPGRRRSRPAAPTASATATAAARATRSAPLCADETCDGATSTSHRRPATPPASAWRPTRCRAAPYVCNGTRCFNACTNGSSAWRPTSAPPTRAGSKTTAPRARRQRVPERASARRASAATGACTGACKSCAWPACSASARTSPRARPIRPACARSRARRAAARTAGARPAPARSTRRHGLPARDLPRRPRPVHAAVDLQRRGRLRDARPRRRASRTAAAPTSARRRAPRTPTASRRPSASPARAASSRPARPARDKHECLSRLLRAGRLLPDGCTGICKSCALTASLGTCSNVADGDTDPPPLRRPGRAQLRHRRPSATATAPAASTTPARSCAAPSCPAACRR